MLYDYRNSRSGQCPKDYLQGFSGYLQVDGYAGYEQTDATLAGCFAHARRKFVEARKAQPKGKTGKADWAISHINKLYRIESGISEMALSEKHAQRQEHAQPLLDQLKTWLEQSSLQVPPKSALGKAIAYSLSSGPNSFVIWTTAISPSTTTGPSCRSNPLSLAARTGCSRIPPAALSPALSFTVSSKPQKPTA